MGGYLTMRLLLFVPTLVLASLLIFGAMRVLPGDPASVILRSEEGGVYVSTEQYQQIREALGLHDPIPVQYGKWIWSMVNGEFGGVSLSNREPISNIVGRRLPVTAQLALYTFLLSVVVSVPPPGASYRVVAGSSRTVSPGSTSIDVERTTSW